MRTFSIGAVMMMVAGGSPALRTQDTSSSQTNSALEAQLRQLQREVAYLHTLVREAREASATNSRSIDRLNDATGDFAEITEVFYVDGRGDLVVEGVNLRVVNGTGATDRVNGRGNILVGYDADCTRCPTVGSHNLVLGLDNAYLSHSGLMTGARNTLQGPYSAIISSMDSTANVRAVSIGGANNAALGVGTIVLAGREGTASGADSAVLSGSQNVSEGVMSTVIGGSDNQACGAASTVTGGVGGMAEDNHESL